jgi:vancomycin permeability regulator SanA
MRPVVAGVPVVLVASVLAVSEWLHWRASRRGLGSPAVEPGREAILVLGFRNRGSRVNHLNRHRVRIALRSIDTRATESVLIFCGGSVGGDTPEADLLLHHARSALGYTGPYRVDRASTTTWENITNTVEILRHFDTIKVASNSLHAERARAFIRQQRPDLAPRLQKARDYRFGETPVAKIAAVIYGVWRERSMRSA